MTQPPQRPPPQGPRPGGYPPDPGYLPPPYPPGQEPIPPREPRRSSPIVAPLLAFVALLLVAVVSFAAIQYLDTNLETAAAETTDEQGEDVEPAGVEAPTAEPTERPQPTEDTGEGPEPTDEVVDEPAEEPETTAEPILVVPPSDERADITGSLVFTRLGGDIWRASGTTLENLTDSNSTKSDSHPTYSPDGKHIYFIRSTKKTVKDGKARYNGKYTLYPTDLMRMKADGSGKPQKIYNSLVSRGGLWFSTVTQPTVSPSGNNVAVVSDGRNGTDDGVTLHIINSKRGNLAKVRTPSESFGLIELGHNDPDFTRDGTKIAFTYNDESGTEGNPRIVVFTCQTKTKCTTGKEKELSRGYANPSWSPDGKLLAVETTDGNGHDIAIITSKKGTERIQLTNDGDSFAPEFSPNGNQIAYLKRNKLNIDVRVITLDIDDRGRITLVSDKAVTSDGTADAGSSLSWYIPKSQLKKGASVDAAEPDASEEPDAALDEAPPPPPGS